MAERYDPPAGVAIQSEQDGDVLRFTITAPLPCPAGQARCLAVVAALWVRDALGGDAVIHWPNDVLSGGQRVCAVTCRAAGETLLFGYELPLCAVADAEKLIADTAHAAADALAGYPDNRPALIQAYCNRCETVMKFVDTVYRGMPTYGFAFAVDKHGGLMVMTQVSRTVVTVYGGKAEIVKDEE